MDKIKTYLLGVWQFIKNSGFTKLLYLVLFIYFSISSSLLLAGAAGGIFIYVNINVLIKLVKKYFKKE